MQSKNTRGNRSDDSFPSHDDASLSPLWEDPKSIHPLSFDLKTEFKQWRRANRILGRHLVIAQQLGGRALRSARWERGMVMLRGIHIEIAHHSLTARH